MSTETNWDAIEERELLLEVVRLAGTLNPQDFATRDPEAFGTLVAVVTLAGVALEHCGEAVVFVFPSLEPSA